MYRVLSFFAILLMATSFVHAANTPFHQGTAKIVIPSDDRNPFSELISGIYFRQPMIRDMQADDFSNPGILSVELGAELWDAVEGSQGKSMAEIWDSCAGVDTHTAATSYPRFHKKAGKVLSLEQQINYCRTEAMGADPYKWETPELLGLTAFIRYQGKGLPVNVSVDGPAAATFERGEDLYYQRLGQLDLACAHCHEGNYGNYIRADMLSQGHVNGFPTYRIKWNSIGSAHRRFRGCNNNIRATKLAYGHEDYVALELYLAWRGNGLDVETPSVRQ